MPSARTPFLDAADVAAAAAAIARGELVVIPTDTVYGVAADPLSAAAARRLFEAKRRPAGLALPVLVVSPKQASLLAAGPDPRALALMAAFWPGPLTLVLPVHPAAGLYLTPDGQASRAGGTVALRQPAHPQALALLRLTGPLAVTSANLSGAPPALQAADAVQQLGAAVTCCVDGGAAELGQPSTILDLAGGAPRVLRAGAITEADIERVLAGPLTRGRVRP
jgi:tRNA threonylcarbamoyl adenosine modification protein (Sua5/YciO/YrdC/YwlC family)